MDHYSCVKKIGSGSYGEVWLVRNKKDRKQYVLKRINLRNATKRELRAANLEVQLLSSLKHPNIVSYRESFESFGLLYIVMGYCEGGDLFSRIKAQRGVPFAERQVVEWFIQICMALQYLHDRKILHRDLKTQNVFLTRNRIIKVGDLGIAKVLDGDGAMATTLIGTPYYMSPELLASRPYSYKSDIWALGCCIYEVATLRHAFSATDMNSLMIKILRGKLPSMPKTYSSELHDLILTLLRRNPDERPTVARILRHPYIKRNIKIFLEDIQPKAVRGADLALRKAKCSEIKPEVAKWLNVDLLLGIRGIQLSLERVTGDSYNQKRKTRLPFGNPAMVKCISPVVHQEITKDTRSFPNTDGIGQQKSLDKLDRLYEGFRITNSDPHPPLEDQCHMLQIEGRQMKLAKRYVCDCVNELHSATGLDPRQPLSGQSKSPLQDEQRFSDVRAIIYETDVGAEPNHGREVSDKDTVAGPNLTVESEIMNGQRARRNSLARQRRRQKLLYVGHEPSVQSMAEVSI